MELLILIPVFVLWIFAAMFYQLHEHVLHNYWGSKFDKWDNKKFDRPWFKNNSRPDLQDHWFFRFLPFTWDGYHCFAWLMKLCYWLIFAIVLYVLLEPYLWFSLLLGLVMSLLDVAFGKLAYRWFFG